MGGGVSLGSFSGAGLSEAIKQAVLHAGYVTTDNEGKNIFTNYDTVVVDVFSGASAGSMALAIMLRGLAHQSDTEISEAENDLHIEGIDLSVITEEKRKAVVAAQVVKNLQYQIWVKEINLDKLLGDTANQKADLIYEPGLLRRKALETIAHDYFQLDEAYNNDFAGRSILSDEVLFASTLSNLTGVVYSTRGNDNTNPNFVGTKDPYTSRSHKELRVFHLNFKNVSVNEIDDNPDKYPSRWIRYHIGEKEEGSISDLRSKSPWARMLATSIACGAFPFVFEPVALERFKFEFVENCWDDNVLTPEVCTIAMESVVPLTKDNLSYPFCYVDGGTFNNEPVKEAFRLASFLDAEDTRDFDRVIVFVDPSIGDEVTNFRLPFLQQYSVKEPRKILGSLDGYDVIKNGTLDRLLSHISSLVTMIIDEGRVKESNRITQISRLFNRKEDYYRVFETLISNETNIEEAIKAILIPVNQILYTRRNSEVIPAGALTLKGEMIRICKDPASKLTGLMSYKDYFTINKLKQIPADLQLDVLKTLLRVLMDQLLDLSGKNQDYKIIAIAPEEVVNGVYKGLDLPGSPLAAFSGFASERANEYAIDLAVYCTQDLMKQIGMLPDRFVTVEKPVWSEDDKQGFFEKFKSKLSIINDRIDNLFHGSHVIDLFYGVDRVILNQLSKIIKDYLAHYDLEAQLRQSYRFMIEVGNKRMELDGTGSFNDAAAFETEGKVYLITELYYYPETIEGKHWRGIHAKDEKLMVDMDGLSVLPDKDFCTIELPSQQQIGIANLMPNPIFMYRKIDEHDKGNILNGNEWTIKPGLKLIERNLLD